jgi:uncharacterized heparinase superfamily protein
MGDPFLDRLAAWWFSLRYQDPEQLPARLRYWLSWQGYRRLPALAQLLADPGRCRPRPDFHWRGEPPPFRFPNAQPGSLLWRFHFHYFDWAPHWDLGSLTAQIEDWIACHPPGSWPSWHPYPTSVRIVNWIRAFGSSMPPHLARSLASQAAFLEHNLESHLGANHLLENAWALLAAGLFFDGAAPRRWAARGLELLRREIPRQVLADGGHYERSPFYHLRMTRLVNDAVDLLRASKQPIPPELTWAAPAMTGFALSLRHLDGSVPSFQDAIFHETLPNYQHPTPHSRPSGFFTLEGPQGRLIADYGAPGTHPNPAHHHAGIFSFEISSPCGLVIVDTGTPTYEPGPERDYLRSTAAHNTVRVDGRDQFQVWAGFRAGRRARVAGIRESTDPDFPAISASHDGYSVLGILHRRTIARVADAGWLIVDELEGSGSHQVESFLHLAPGITPEIAGHRIFLHPLGWTLLPFGFSSAPIVIDSTYAPSLGDHRPSKALVFSARSAPPVSFGYFLGPRSFSRLLRDSHNVFCLDAIQLALSLF